MLNMPARPLIYCAALLLTGCLERVRLRTEPPGAAVMWRGRVVGQTPMVLEMPHEEMRDRDPVRFTLDGYEPADAELRTHVSTGRIITSMVLTGGLSLLVRGPTLIQRLPVVRLAPSAQ